jgi:hypothetical protein
VEQFLFLFGLYQKGRGHLEDIGVDNSVELISGHHAFMSSVFVNDTWLHYHQSASSEHTVLL